MRAASARQSESDDARARRRRRFFAGTAGIAAAAVAVVAVAAGLIGHGAGESSKASSAAAPAESPVAHPAVPAPSRAATTDAALGAFTDAHTLALAAVAHLDRLGKQVQPNAASTAPAASSQKVAPGSTDQQFSSSGTAKNAEQSTTVPAASTAAGSADKSISTPLPPCSIPPSVPSADVQVLRATATLAGAPVIVIVFAGSGEHVVVVEDFRCHLLDVQMLG